MHMIEIMRRNFTENTQIKFLISKNQLGKMEAMSQIAEQFGMYYPEVPVSGYVAQPVNEFLFPWEE